MLNRFFSQRKPSGPARPGTLIFEESWAGSATSPQVLVELAPYLFPSLAPPLHELPPMAIEAARLSPSLAAAAFLARRPPPALFPFSLRRRIPLLHVLAGSSGGDGRVVALSSSELRKRRGLSSSSGAADPASDGDEKLRSLRRLFARPDVAIDAYIVPSQDAHQVAAFPT